MEIVLLLVVVTVPIWLNVKATLLVFRDAFSEKTQKITQLIFVWFLPLVGAIVVLAIHRQEEKSSGTYPSEKDPGEDFGLSGSSIKNITKIIDGD
ncbi:hypothetical protein ABHF33_11380 [Chitinibacter sp. FCG-7]|uniref:Cardiolipin synthase N-terminal domain-containing protein n=1 Tax=Chitinibacter mangrovi TaxID=3153927 RepID=A0AAU7F6N9_9NEIS